MASGSDQAVFVEPLPARPNLEMQHKRAKELLRAAWDGDEEALTRIRALHPKPPAADALKLADAHLVSEPHVANAVEYTVRPDGVVREVDLDTGAAHRQLQPDRVEILPGGSRAEATTPCLSRCPREQGGTR